MVQKRASRGLARSSAADGCVNKLLEYRGVNLLLEIDTSLMVGDPANYTFNGFQPWKTHVDALVNLRAVYKLYLAARRGHIRDRYRVLDLTVSLHRRTNLRFQSLCRPRIVFDGRFGFKGRVGRE